MSCSDHTGALHKNAACMHFYWMQCFSISRTKVRILKLDVACTIIFFFSTMHLKMHVNFHAFSMCFCVNEPLEQVSKEAMG